MNDQGYKLTIEAGKSNSNYFKDLWRYRELLYFLTWRDILIRYKQAIIGIAWSVLRPMLTILVFSIVFGKIAKLPQGGIPYPILVITGLLPWQFFANAISESSLSLISNTNLITKIYFPRMLIPVSTIAVSFVDFVISFVILIGLMIWYGYFPGWEIILLPLFIVLAIIPAFGAGLWFSALNVKYRDFRYIVPFFVWFGLLISPVGYTSGIIENNWSLAYSLNPMVGVINGFRWSILGDGFYVNIEGFIISLLISVTLLISGILYFRKTERVFADII